MKRNTLVVFGLVVSLNLVSLPALADVVVVMGINSPVTTLTREQVTDIYLGKVRELPTGGIAAPTMVGGTPAKDEFFSRVIGKSDSEIRAIWARMTFTGKGVAPRELKDAAEVKKMLASNPRALGFIDRSALDSSVKVVYAP
ncbi:phosphate ABC transporter substrate-binding protein [Aquabacterium sp.]|uniref:phosphate ABC transporter substrate-binding protein n=1 Tax=Aquabacterium sp. TaxID=1872578 RepID=UPI0035B31E64